MPAPKLHIGIAGAGFAGAVLARELAETGEFRVSVFDERPHVAGLCHTERDPETGVMVHTYGLRSFVTDREDVWTYLNRWGRIEPYRHRVRVVTERGIFPLPLNLPTLNQFFGLSLSPAQARDFLGNPGKREQRLLQDNFFSRDPRARFTYEDNFYDHKFQGNPVSGYTEIVRRILDHQAIDVRLGQRLEPERKKDFDHLFWSGPMDGYFNHRLGRLGYTSMHFERLRDHGDYQGCPVIEGSDPACVRISEHKHMAPWERHERTVVYKEYATACGADDVPFISAGDQFLFERYLELADAEEGLTFMGRLGTYRDLMMDEVIGEALDLARACRELPLPQWPRGRAALSTFSSKAPASLL